nr:divalent metal cation transporter [uncultured Desulfobulbus sp.]
MNLLQSLQDLRPRDRKSALGALQIVRSIGPGKKYPMVEELPQAQSLLAPLLGSNAADIFAIALLFAGLASTVTSAISGGSVFAGMFNEPYDIQDSHSRLGIFIVLVGGFGLLLLVNDAFKALLVSQMVLSVQLPLTVCMQVSLTSSITIMGKHANPRSTKLLLGAIAAVVSGLNGSFC